MPGEQSGMEAVLGGARRGGWPRAWRAAVLAGGLLVTLGAVAVGYRAAAASGAFDVRRIEIVGAAAQRDDVAAAVRAGVGGRSLLEVDPAAIAADVAALPGVRRAQVDRSFPDAIAVRVVLERPVAIAPTGRGARVVSASGRVIGRVDRATRRLPVIAAAPADVPGVGGVVRAGSVLDEIAVAAAARRSWGIVAVGYTADGLVARLADGVEIRLGDGTAISRKLLVARSVLRRAGGPVRYVDVSVPDAPAVRAETPDAATADAPPAPLPATAAAAGAAGDAAETPAESARSLFG